LRRNLHIGLARQGTAAEQKTLFIRQWKIKKKKGGEGEKLR